MELEQLFANLDTQAPLKELERGDSSLEEAANAAIRGDYQRAAQLAAERYAEGYQDARLLGYLLYGLLLERGPESLVHLLRALLTLLGDKRAAVSPVQRRDSLLDGAAHWFIGKLVQQLERAEQQRSDAWQKWRTAAKDGQLASALPIAEQLQPILASLTPKPRAAVSLLHLVDLLHQLIDAGVESERHDSTESRGDPSFSSAATLSAKEPARAEQNHESDDKHESLATSRGDDSGDADDDVKPWAADGAATSASSEATSNAPRPPQPPALEQGSPAAESAKSPQGVALPPLPTPSEIRAPQAPRRLLPGFATPSAVQASKELIQLARKIDLFVSLIRAEEHLHAAVVSVEVQRAIDSFDPRVYLPALVAPYFRALAQASAELGPILEQREHLTFKALAQLYKVEPECFSQNQQALQSAQDELPDSEDNE